MVTNAGPATDPILAVLETSDPAVLAVIAGVEGPSYRPVGAMMAVFGGNHRAGTLSSGCIEADISLHAVEALRTNTPRMLRYGRGSPFADIQLPCGGGLDVFLAPNPDRAVLARLNRRRSARRPCVLEIDFSSGALGAAEAGGTGRIDGGLRVRIEPEIRFVVFGKGPEASTFSALVLSAGYPHLVLSPDDETLDIATRAGCATRRLVKCECPADLDLDDRTAVVLFFHDHEWEPPILEGALKTAAFYIGAQGSLRARDERHRELEAMGVPEDALSRLHGPVGLIPSARDPKTLAVSVLAEVLAKAQAG